MAESSGGKQHINGRGMMPRTRSMGAMAVDQELLDEIKKLSEKLHTADKQCTDMKKQLQEARRREQQLKLDHSALLQKQKKLEKLNKGKSWKRRSKETFGSSHNEHADEIKEGLKLNKISLSGSGSSQTSNPSPLSSSSSGSFGRKQKPFLNTYEDGASGRKRKDSHPKFFHFEDKSDSDEENVVVYDSFGEDDDDDDDDEYEDNEGQLKLPQRQYSSPDKVSSRKIKRMQKTHSVPVSLLFANSPETNSPTQDARRYFEKLELDWNQTLNEACAKGNSSLVAKLLRDPSTVAINTSLMKGKNLLAVALRNHDFGSWLDVVGILLTAGALVDETDEQGNTALHLALLHPKPTSMDQLLQVVDAIISKSNTIDAKNSLGNTALLLAVHNGSSSSNSEAKECYENIIRSLLNRGANMNIKNRYHDSPLLWAAKEGAANIVKLCIDHDETILDIKDQFGNTPLILAAQFGYKEICELLVKKGANITATNSNGKNSLDVARDHHIRKLLEDYNPGLKSWKWLVDISDVVFKKNKEELLGEGKFSKCILGKLHGTYVAVKKFKREASTVNQFQSEVGLMSDIRHPNIVLFLGACYQENHLCIITEYLRRGSLRQFLRSYGFSILPRGLILKLAGTTARGMAWLHSRDPVVLHRDLHAKNILLTDSLECKVADFGLSQIEIPINRIGDNMFYKRINPPEVRRGEKYTTASDIYQYGMVLYEMLFLRQKATPNLVFDHIQNSAHPDILDLMKRCCKELTIDRPASFLEIIETLEAMPQEETNSEIEAHLLSQMVEKKELTEAEKEILVAFANGQGVLDEGYIE